MVEVESVPGQTIFRMNFPLAHDRNDPAAPTALAEGPYR
jgi:nitrogen-specific signal transduction histidine kinase